MCEWVAGQLIVSFPRSDDVGRRLVRIIRENDIPDITHIEDLETRLARVGLTLDPHLDYEYHLLGVPVGEELWSVTYLHHLYRRELLDHILRNPRTRAQYATSDQRFNVAPNHLLAVNFNWRNALFGAPQVINGATFQFSAEHAAYRAMIGAATLSLPPEAPEVKVAILDSGIADDMLAEPYITAKANVESPPIAPTHPVIVTDRTGHGTAIAKIIHDVMPKAQLHICKIVDDTGLASEWAAIAGLAATLDAHVVNISWEYGLRSTKCRRCGRASHAAKSQAFATFIDFVRGRPESPIVVASTGNDHVASLAYPSRFGNVLAIGSVNSRKELSDFSNYGNKDHENEDHLYHFVLPGGESDGATESIGQFGPGGDEIYGTSFAAAYASGVVAAVIAREGIDTLRDGGVLGTLIEDADRGFASYKSIEHGHGIMRL